MSDWQEPKTDWDTNPMPIDGATMNRIEGNIDYLKNTFPYEIFFISGANTALPVTTQQLYFVSIPDGYELRLLSANYYISTTVATKITLGEIGGAVDEYFDSSLHGGGALANEVQLNTVMETNTTGSDMSVNLGVYTDDLAGGGWSFKLALVKL